MSTNVFFLNSSHSFQAWLHPPIFFPFNNLFQIKSEVRTSKYMIYAWCILESGERSYSVPRVERFKCESFSRDIIQSSAAKQDIYRLRRSKAVVHFSQLYLSILEKIYLAGRLYTCTLWPAWMLTTHTDTDWLAVLTAQLDQLQSWGDN